MSDAPPRPPRLAWHLLAACLHPDDREAARSDLLEEFDTRCHRDGARAASRWYRMQVRRSIAPALIGRLAGAWSRLAPGRDVVWAWRGLRARGSGAWLHVLLVAIATGASAVVFSAADAFVFRPGAYPNADRLVVFQRTSPVGLVDYLTQDELREWRARSDLFSAIHAHGMLTTMFYLHAGGVTDAVRAWDIAPGLFDALGARPRSGRPFVAGDAEPGAEPVVIISASLARRLAGSPDAAVDLRLDSPSGPRRVVGVMPEDFRFPTAQEHIWVPLPESALARVSPMVVAVIAPGASVNVIRQAMAAGVSAGDSGRPSPIGPPQPTSLAEARKDPRALTNYSAFSMDGSRRLFIMLLGTAVCLTLIACLNVASLNVAAALRRAHVYTVQTTLGATRGSQVRTALLEGVLLTSAGAAAGLCLASAGTTWFVSALPPALAAILSNPIDLDVRAVGFTAVISFGAWIVSSLPIVWRASRQDPAAALQRAGRSMTLSRGTATLRHLLMTGQVVLSVVLLAGALLFAQSYTARVGRDHGFDDRRLAFLDVVRPRTAAIRAQDLARDLLDRLGAHPAVERISRGPQLPPSPRASSTSWLRIDGAATPAGVIQTFSYSVAPDFFETAGIRLAQGQSFRASDTGGGVVIDEAFARRYWPTGGALGAQINLGRADQPAAETYEVIGIASNLEAVSSAEVTGGEAFGVYRPLAPDSSSLGFVIRLTSDDALADVAAVARSLAPGALVRVRTMADRYHEVFGDARLAMALTAVFGTVAFVVAIAGLYAVTAFLVAARAREIGIRVALGAGRHDIRRLVIAPVVRFVGLGAAVGVVCALTAAGWIRSQLFGVTPTDPWTYVVAAALILATAVAAAWAPARAAARVDPAVTLRTE